MLLRGSRSWRPRWPPTPSTPGRAGPRSPTPQVRPPAPLRGLEAAVGKVCGGQFCGMEAGRPGSSRRSHAREDRQWSPGRRRGAGGAPGADGRKGQGREARGPSPPPGWGAGTRGCGRGTAKYPGRRFPRSKFPEPRAPARWSAPGGLMGRWSPRTDCPGATVVGGDSSIQGPRALPSREQGGITRVLFREPSGRLASVCRE